MNGSTVALYINIQQKDNPLKFDIFPIMGMKMEGYPESNLKWVTYHDGTSEQVVEFDGNTMGILENPNTERIIKIRIINNGKILLQPNKNLQDIEVFGILELAKAQFTKAMFDRADREKLARN